MKSFFVFLLLYQKNYESRQIYRSIIITLNPLNSKYDEHIILILHKTVYICTK